MPLQHSYCLSLLADYAKPGMSVLDVGSGSGYLTAVFGLMVWTFTTSCMKPEFLFKCYNVHFFMLLEISCILKFVEHPPGFFPPRLERQDVLLELSIFQSLWRGPLMPSSRRLLGSSWTRAELLCLVSTTSPEKIKNKKSFMLFNPTFICESLLFEESMTS